MGRVGALSRQEWWEEEGGERAAAVGTGGPRLCQGGGAPVAREEPGKDGVVDSGGLGTVERKGESSRPQAWVLQTQDL